VPLAKPLKKITWPCYFVTAPRYYTEYLRSDSMSNPHFIALSENPGEEVA
jgi:hypothetical protein